jgi:hypothetical protein
MATGGPNKKKTLIILRYVNNRGPPLWFSGYRSRDPGFDSRRYQIFWKVVDLERGPLSLWVQLSSYLEETVAAPV